MTLLTFWPYLLLIPALMLGTLLGWHLHAARHRRTAAPGGSFATPAMAMPADRRRQLQEAELEVAQLDAQLAVTNQKIATYRQQLQAHEDELSGLLVDIDEQQAAIKDARRNSQNYGKNLAAEHSKLLSDIDNSGEELEMLEKLNETYTARIQHLTQQVSWQDSEIQLLHQGVREKTAEIKEAEALIAQYAVELRRLNRKCQQRENDIKKARQTLMQRDDELRRLVGHDMHSGQLAGLPPTTDQGTGRKDVTPPGRPQLPEHSSSPGDGL